jgi:chromosome segregation ATPase
MNEIVESLGQMTFANEETEFRLDSLQKNMDDLQESYNDMASKLGEATEKLLGSEDKLKESVSLNESLSTEVVELRKRLAVEARGLSWDRYSTLLEGVTTDREISEKLDSLSHYSGSSKRFDAKGLKDVLKESEVPQNDHSSSLRHIVSQV